MSSLVWVIILLSFLLDKSSSQMLQGERVGIKRPAADMEDPTDALPRRRKKFIKPPGSVYCEAKQFCDRKYISLKLEPACHEARARLSQDLIKSSKKPQIISMNFLQYLDFEDGYHVWETVLETNLREYKYEKLLTIYNLRFYQEKLNPSRCFPKLVYGINHKSRFECQMTSLRKLQVYNPYFSLARWNCKNRIFTAGHIRNALEDAYQKLRVKQLSTEKNSQQYPHPFKDRLFIAEKDLWVYPLMPDHLIYNNDMEKGDYRIVFTGFKSLAGVVYERTMEDRNNDKDLDSAIQFIPCERNR
ncbi:hypothetical protein GcM3_099011 [Golovinomyces cichoracearum]|uniref:Secreted effector protein n=1 Tax=Golovinomyces cichoracearum TaxID=62708 RepID=A0A420IBT3_9PEZI|nr:hypothetical protein GcM3_099011 [Golovinomyces cichoracearum]